MQTRKGIYRYAKQRIIGGVCSGLSYYLKVDKVFLRILFLISVFMFGLTIPLYLILWAIIPKARTEEEIQEMKGEFYKPSSGDLTEAENHINIKPLSGSIIGGVHVCLATFLFIMILGVLFKAPLIIELITDAGWQKSEFVQDLYSIPLSFQSLSFSRFLTLVVFLIPVVYLFVIGINILKPELKGGGKVKSKLLLFWIVALFINFLL